MTPSVGGGGRAWVSPASHPCQREQTAWRTRTAWRAPPPGARRSAAVAPQARFAGADGGLGAVGDPQLGEDAGDVVADRLQAQGERGGDRPIVAPLRDQGEDL